jgi:hypothetical protein
MEITNGGRKIRPVMWPGKRASCAEAAPSCFPVLDVTVRPVLESALGRVSGVPKCRFGTRAPRGACPGVLECGPRTNSATSAQALSWSRCRHMAPGPEALTMIAMIAITKGPTSSRSPEARANPTSARLPAMETPTKAAAPTAPALSVGPVRAIRESPEVLIHQDPNHDRRR